MTKELFKKNIYRLRKDRGWSQQKLADEAGVSYHTVFRAEAGTVPLGENITKLARALGVSEGDLFKDPDEPSPKAASSLETKAELIIEITSRLATLNEDELGAVLSLMNGFPSQTARRGSSAG